jgi:hypothetical protein
MQQHFLITSKGWIYLFPQEYHLLSASPLFFSHYVLKVHTAQCYALLDLNPMSKAMESPRRSNLPGDLCGQGTYLVAGAEVYHSTYPAQDKCCFRHMSPFPSGRTKLTAASKIFLLTDSSFVLSIDIGSVISQQIIFFQVRQCVPTAWLEHTQAEAVGSCPGMHF